MDVSNTTFANLGRAIRYLLFGACMQCSQKRLLFLFLTKEMTGVFYLWCKGAGGRRRRRWNGSLLLLLLLVTILAQPLRWRWPCCCCQCLAAAVVKRRRDWPLQNLPPAVLAGLQGIEALQMFSMWIQFFLPEASHRHVLKTHPGLFRTPA